MYTKKIVVPGGGTGASTVLRTLKGFDDVSLTGIPGVFDSGGSAGVISDEHGKLPSSDVLQHIDALSPDDDSELQEVRRILLAHRFAEGVVEGRRIGNYMLVALTDHYGSEQIAIAKLCAFFKIRGAVHPVSFSRGNLRARYVGQDRTYYAVGESQIDEAPEPWQRMYKISMLDFDTPLPPRANPLAVQSIEEADLVVFGPGDLFTSTIPNLLLSEILEALSKTHATVAFVMNHMTKPGQTSHITPDGSWIHMSAVDHLNVLLGVLDGAHKVDVILIQDYAKHPFPADIVSRYKKEGSAPVWDDTDRLSGYRVIRGAFASDVIHGKHPADHLKRSYIRHGGQLGDALYSLI